MQTGLFFGSFNPIHIGHLAIANYFVEFTSLDSVWFVISPQNPLKSKDSLLNDYHRLELVRLAIGDDLRFRASDIEFKMPKPSYTTDTLARLEEKFPTHTFSLIMGMDNLATLYKWKNFEVILQNWKLWVYPRKGWNLEKIPDLIKPKLQMARYEVVNAPEMEISSTFLRHAIREGKDVRFFFQDAVYQYIREMHFYEK